MFLVGQKVLEVYPFIRIEKEMNNASDNIVDDVIRVTKAS